MRYVLRCEMTKTVDVYVEAASESDAKAQFAAFNWTDENEVDTVEVGPIQSVRAMPKPVCGQNGYWCHGTCGRHGYCCYVTPENPTPRKADAPPTR